MVNLSPHSVETYELQFAKLVNKSRAIAFSNARTALRSALASSGLTRGDEVIISPLTCKVIPLTLISLDLTPVYADISQNTLNLDCLTTKSAITRATRAIIFQHTYGDSAGVEDVTKISAEKKILLIEDCAHCMPYVRNGQSSGKWGNAAIFSNNLRKPLPAGSGGFFITNDAELARKTEELRSGFPYLGNYSKTMRHIEILIHKYLLRPISYWPFYEFNRTLCNWFKKKSLETEIDIEITQASFQLSKYQIQEGQSWLDKVGPVAEHRLECCAEYTEALRNIQGIIMPCADSSGPLYYFPVLVNNKEDILRKARNRLIELVSWPLRTPIYPIEKESELFAYGYQPGSCPIAEDVAKRLIGLPTDHFTHSKQRKAIISLLTNQ